MFGFSVSADRMSRYILNYNTKRVVQYDMMGNVQVEDMDITPYINTTAKPVHCVMLVDKITSCGVRVITTDDDIQEYNLSVSAYKAYEMLAMLLGNDIRFRVQKMAIVQGIEVAAYMLFITDKVDIIGTLNKLPKVN